MAGNPLSRPSCLGRNREPVTAEGTAIGRRNHEGTMTRWHDGLAGQTR